jgi:hypothetical protein
MKRRRFEHLGMLHCGEFLDSLPLRGLLTDSVEKVDPTTDAVVKG